MKLILLDRNVISHIKRKLSGKKIPDEVDRSLRLLDKEDHKISAILSIREGQSGEQENKQQMLETLKLETNAIAKFFKRASTDCAELNSLAETFIETFTKNTELKWNNYVSFANQSQEIILEPKSDKEKQIQKNNIINLANQNDVSPSHPIVICYLSVLFGCSETRRILKPKKSRTIDENNKALYNILNDILVFSRLSMIQAISDEERYKNQQLKYVTFDKGLNFFIKSLKVNKIDTTAVGNNVATLTNITCSRKLFPDLKEESYTELMLEIKRYSENDVNDAQPAH